MDFVRLTRLEAQLSEDARGIRIRHDQNSSESVWRRASTPLGKGGMGKVFREVCVAGDNEGALRAVKAIQKPNSQSASKMDYGRELEAIARFSQPQVRKVSLVWPL